MQPCLLGVTDCCSAVNCRTRQLKQRPRRTARLFARRCSVTSLASWISLQRVSSCSVPTWQRQLQCLQQGSSSCNVCSSGRGSTHCMLNTLDERFHSVKCLRVLSWQTEMDPASVSCCQLSGCYSVRLLREGRKHTHHCIAMLLT